MCDISNYVFAYCVCDKFLTKIQHSMTAITTLSYHWIVQNTPGLNPFISLNWPLLIVFLNFVFSKVANYRLLEKKNMLDWIITRWQTLSSQIGPTIYFWKSLVISRTLRSNDVVGEIYRGDERVTDVSAGLVLVHPRLNFK